MEATTSTVAEAARLRRCAPNVPATTGGRNGVDWCGRTATVRQTRREETQHGRYAGWRTVTTHRCEEHRLPIEWVESTVTNHAGFPAPEVAA